VTSLEGLLTTRGIHQPRTELSPQGYADLYRLWQEQYERSGAHPANVLNDIVAEVDHSWTYYQDLTKRVDVLAAKMQSYRDNLAIIHAGEKMFGRSFFTHREQRA
jgi:hypothetical protein